MEKLVLGASSSTNIDNVGTSGEVTPDGYGVFCIGVGLLCVGSGLACLPGGVLCGK